MGYKLQQIREPETEKLMAKSHCRSPRVAISRSISRARVHSPSVHRKKVSVSSDPVEADQSVEFLAGGGGEAEYVGNVSSGSDRYGNKVMVVVDSSLDSTGALAWALSHTVQSQDTVVLLYVHHHPKSSQQGKGTNGKKLNLRVYEKLHAMKNICQMKKPGVQVEIAIAEGKEKGGITVEEAKKQNVSLLVLGQKRKSILRRLVKRWAPSKNRKAVGDIVDYCIQNSSCMTIAVRRKSSKLGGYLITTKRHKNFWLLA